MNTIKIKVDKITSELLSMCCLDLRSGLKNTLNHLKIPSRSSDNAKYTILCFGGGHVVLISLSTIWIFCFKFCCSGIGIVVIPFKHLIHYDFISFNI